MTRVGPTDWERLRRVRLASLAESPEMFGSTLAREEAFDEAEWRRRAARPATFLATCDGEDVGMGGVYEVDGTWTVAGMWLAPDARGSGLVDLLLGACEEVVRAAGAHRVQLGVMEDNPRGRRAYERNGYAPTGERVHVRDGRHEVMLGKTLG
ncbi:GNAT family N-acetyltransferase [Nocardioides solisilvae]|uniref:GNAT family N-acetyltransferase n=1 Tax=Nocardioides solisilvae TaxID=1542435 RepID=UPI0013A548A5|nr:GNAT family N-acetyltransferase [Nocardioides solisilvae]